MKKEFNISIVIPCNNEEEVLLDSVEKITKKLTNLAKKFKIDLNSSQIVIVDNGSTDKTWQVIKKLNKNNIFIKGIKLANNFGHQSSLLAGLDNTNCDVIVSLDADLQDDLDTIDIMIEKYLEGYEIVYGVRKDRKKDSFFERNFAKIFYFLINILDQKIIINHADFRLLTRKALDNLKQFKEVNIFIRGIVTKVSNNSSIVYYKRNERKAGKSKYTFLPKISLALDGFTSFSLLPLRIIAFIGLIIFILSLIIIIYYFISYLFIEKTVRGWTTLILSIYLLGGLQIFCLGIIAEYIGKIYLEAKKRPRYLIDQILNQNKIK